MSNLPHRWIVVSLILLGSVLDLHAVTASKACWETLPGKRKPGLVFPKVLPEGYIKLSAFMTNIHNGSATKSPSNITVAWTEQLMAVEAGGSLNQSAVFKQSTLAGKLSVEQWVHLLQEGHQEYLYIKEQHDCVKEKDWTAASKGNPINFPMEMIAEDFPSFNPRSIYDLLLFANRTVNITHQPTQTGGDVSYGLPYEQYTSCTHLPKRKHWLEIRVIYAKADSGSGWNTTMRDAIPMTVEVLCYAENTTSKSSSEEQVERRKRQSNETSIPEYFLRYVGITATQQVSKGALERFFMPPAGTHCQNGTLAEPMPLPELPTVFSASVEVYSEEKMKIDLIPLHYDWNSKLVGFSFNKTKSATFEDNNLFTYGVTDIESGGFHVVHDYRHGLQYLQTEAPGFDCTVKSIPTAVAPRGTGKIDASGRLLEMKTPLELFFLPQGIERSDFSYAGVRRFMDMDADVWCAEAEVTESSPGVNSTVSIELYFTKGFELMSGSGKIKDPQLIGVILWHKDHTDAATWVTSNTYHVHNLVSFGVDGTLGSPFQHVQLAGCMQVADNSFVAAEIKSPTWSEMMTNENVLLPVLRQKLADVANVSTLRIQDLTVARMPSKKPAVFFRLANSSSVPFKHFTVNQSAESSLNASLKRLKDAFAKGDLSVSVTVGKDEKKMSLLKNSLADTNSFYTGSHDEKTGHSSGAMAGLALLMLVMGAGIGAGAAWYKWKRAPGGFQYHVYE